MKAFQVYLPESNKIYDCVQQGLLIKKFRKIWINEAKSPVIFKCQSCKQSKIDLSQLPLAGSKQPIISARMLRKEVPLSMIPLSIICNSCQSVYYILNGMIEPNNGRTVIVFDDIIMIEKNHVIERKSRILAKKIEGRPDIWKPYIPRFYRKNSFRIADIEMTFFIEKSTGNDGSKPYAQVSIFAEESQSSAGMMFLEFIQTSIQAQIDNSIQKRERITENIIFIISGIKFSSTSSKEGIFTELSDSAKVALRAFSDDFIQLIFNPTEMKLEEMLHSIEGLYSFDLLAKE